MVSRRKLFLTLTFGRPFPYTHLQSLVYNTCFASAAQGIRFVLLLSRQGKVRLAKWYTTYTQKERSKVRTPTCSGALLECQTPSRPLLAMCCMAQSRTLASSASLLCEY